MLEWANLPKLSGAQISRSTVSIMSSKEHMMYIFILNIVNLYADLKVYWWRTQEGGDSFQHQLQLNIFQCLHTAMFHKLSIWRTDAIILWPHISYLCKIKILNV